VLYTGVTNSLVRRISQHKEKKVPGFTQKYGLTKLVWFELFGTPSAAIGREKEIKSWRRAKKIALIEASNPAWRDLSSQ